MKKRKSPTSLLTCVDIFSGAGSYSEGFAQEGFSILRGYDLWPAAAKTFKLNHQVECEQVDVLVLASTIESINTIPNSTVLLGSPPCVSFSSSNMSGKANKMLGKKLMRAYLKIVAVKKYQRGSILKAWYMENVGKSAAHLNKSYTFKQLGLSDWAKKIGKKENEIALFIKKNSAIINAADHGSPQSRKRLFVGEIIGMETAFPKSTHNKDGSNGLLPYNTLKNIRDILPSPDLRKELLNGVFFDPNYSNVSIQSTGMSDHFYDTGLKTELWKRSEYLKTNHPFMGKMSFPENEARPSRTVMATNIGSSRESFVLKCERGRIGNGEYRSLTVRESACLMGFPITYQFFGGVSNKLKLVGNAVCTHVSRALAREVKRSLGKRLNSKPTIKGLPKLHVELKDLNTFSTKEFTQYSSNKPSKFRMHLYKDGNMTIDLMNFDFKSSRKNISEKWKTFVFYSNGQGSLSKIHEIRPNQFKKLEHVITQKVNNGKTFIKLINNGFSERIPSGKKMQLLLDKKILCEHHHTPFQLLQKIDQLISTHPNIDDRVIDKSLPFKKKDIPLKQVMALYALNKVVSVANELNAHESV